MKIRLKKFTSLMLAAILAVGTIQPISFAQSININTHPYESCNDITHEHEKDHIYEFNFATTENDNCHTNCCDNILTGKGVTIAVLDAGINAIETVKEKSFVNDVKFNSHGDEMALTLSEYAPDADIIDVRVLDSEGKGRYSDISKAIVWSVDNGADIIVMSFAGYGASSILSSAINYADENNVLLISAAGNRGADVAVYPAAYPSVISVGALDENNEIAPVSNYGDNVDTYISAQGGTSYAAQVFAGICAQYIQQTPEITTEQIRKMTASENKKAEIKADCIDSYVYAAACSHSFNGSYTTTKKETCTTSGTKVGKCTKCNTVVSTITIKPLGHSGTPTTTKQATCKTTGTVVTKCSRCKTTLATVTTPKTNHIPKDTYTIIYKNPCTSFGEKYKECKFLCGTVLSSVEKINPLGHEGKTTTKEATCSSTGSVKVECKRCKTTLATSSIPADKTKHNYVTVTTEATCTTRATKTTMCTICKTTLPIAYISEKKDHNYVIISEKTPTRTDGGYRISKCINCGKQKNETLLPRKYTTTVNCYFDNGYLYNKTDEERKANIAKHMETVSDAFMELFNLYITNNVIEYYSSPLDSCKGTVNSSNIGEVCVHSGTEHSDRDNVLSDFMDSFTGGNKITNVLWTKHKILSDSGDEDKPDINRSCSYESWVLMLNESESTLMHELCHQFGAKDHYHEGEEEVCEHQKNGCSECADKKSRRPADCLMAGGTNIYNICDKCKTDIINHLQDHHINS